MKQRNIYWSRQECLSGGFVAAQNLKWLVSLLAEREAPEIGAARKHGRSERVENPPRKINPAKGRRMFSRFQFFIGLDCLWGVSAFRQTDFSIPIAPVYAFRRKTSRDDVSRAYSFRGIEVDRHEL